MATNIITDGAKAFEDDVALWMSDPEFHALFDLERQKRRLWEKLMETREASGLTQEQMAKRLKIKTRDWVRLEETGFDHCTFDELYEYVANLGCGLTLQVTIGNAVPEQETVEKADSEPKSVIPTTPEPVLRSRGWWQKSIKPAIARSFAFLTAPIGRFRHQVQQA